MMKAVFFDLDGTLLPMDQDEFTRGYFKLLAKKLAPHGNEPEPFIRAIWHGTKAMVQNDGSQSNEAAFWDDFAAIYGEAARKDEALFLEFYTVDCPHARKLCGSHPKAAESLCRAGCPRLW